MNGLLSKHVASACRTRQQLGEGDMSPILTVLRGGQEVAVVGVVSEEVVRLGRMAAAGFRADTMILVVDSFLSWSPVNPDTGQPWGPKELGQVFSSHGGGGGVSEAMMVWLETRSGVLEIVSVPYRRGGEEWQWGAPIPMNSRNLPRFFPEVGEGKELVPLFPDALVARVLENKGAVVLSTAARGVQN